MDALKLSIDLLDNVSSMLFFRDCVLEDRYLERV